MNLLRQEILQRVAQMHDLQKWKLISCGSVFAFIITKGIDETSLILIVPAILCIVIDTHYVQHIINVMTIGRFCRDDKAEDRSLENRYEGFLTEERKAHGFLYSLESIANVIISEIVALTPVGWVMFKKSNALIATQIITLWMIVLILFFAVLVPYVLLWVFATRVNYDRKKNRYVRNK